MNFKRGGILIVKLLILATGFGVFYSLVGNVAPTARPSVAKPELASHLVVSKAETKELLFGLYSRRQALVRSAHLSTKERAQSLKSLDNLIERVAELARVPQVEIDTE